MPERFLDENGQIDRRVRNPDLAAFGFSRRLVASIPLSEQIMIPGYRICPGRHLAMNSMMITVASVLSAFNIEHAIDEFGQEVLVKDEMSSGFIV